MLGGPACYCGIAGCLESIASGSALGQAAQSIGLRDARELFAAARDGSATAQAIVHRAIDAACTAAWTVFHTILPQRLVLGGGMMDTEFDLFAGPMRERIAKATQFTPGAVDIVPARLGNDAGIVGGASLFGRPG
jgi:glucokinase